jgi:hypothetical protein
MAVAWITEMLTSTIEVAIPNYKQSSYSKKWWSCKLTSLLNEYKTAQHQVAKKNALDRSWQTAHTACNRYHAAMHRQKRQHWHNWIEEATEKSVWLANKYVSNSSASLSTAARLPMPNGHKGPATSSVQKANALLHTFFSPLHRLILTTLRTILTLMTCHLLRLVMMNSTWPSRT